MTLESGLRRKGDLSTALVKKSYFGNFRTEYFSPFLLIRLKIYYTNINILSFLLQRKQ